MDCKEETSISTRLGSIRIVGFLLVSRFFVYYDCFSSGSGPLLSFLEAGRFDIYRSSISNSYSKSSSYAFFSGYSY